MKARSVLVATCLSLTLVSCGDGHGVPFDEAGWKAGDGYARSDMVDDLIESKQLHGLALDEVVERLGAPSSVHEQWIWADPDLHATYLAVNFVDGRLSNSLLYSGGENVSADEALGDMPIPDRWTAADFDAAQGDERLSLLAGLRAAVEAGDLDAAALREVGYPQRSHSVSLRYEFWTDDYEWLEVHLDESLRVARIVGHEAWDKASERW